MSVSATPAPFAFLASSCFLIAFALLVALVPSGAQADIIACAGVTSAHYEVEVGSGDGQINSWGNDDSECYGSRVTGLPRVRSFTFWVKRYSAYSGTPTAAVGNIVDDNYVEVASVNITGLLPIDSAAHSVTADFGEMIALNASRTYTFAFCATGGGTTEYSMEGVQANENFRYCQQYASCIASGADWQSYLGYSMRTAITGSCGSSAASQLAPWGALAHVASLLTALWRY